MADKAPAQSTLNRQLWGAAAECNANEVKRLLQAGANPNSVFQKLSALQMAVGAGNQRETRIEDDGRVVVIQHDPQETVEALLAAGADPDKPDSDGRTPFMSSTYSPELVRMLLPRVKDINARARDGTTALALASINRYEEVAQILVENGASWDVVAASDEKERKKARRQDELRKHQEKAIHDRWPAPQFTQAAVSPAFTDARARLQTICNGSVCTIGGAHGEHIACAMPRSRVMSLIDAHQSRFLADGAYLFGSGTAAARDPGEADQLSLLPTTSVYDVILYVGTNRNDGVGPAAVCDGLKELSEYVSFTITRANFDTLEGRWGEIADPKRLARDLYKFCPDIVDQGVGSVAALAERLKEHNDLYLWWD